MITQVTYPTTGEVEVNGRVSALLELTAGFDPEFTGRENIYFRGSLLGLKEHQVKKIEPLVEEFAELGDYMDQPVRTYSSGMKARLGFAINVNIDPEILIVDEALSVGDKSFQRKCKEKVKHLTEEKNVTFLFVTHSTKTAADFCERGIVMKKGKKVFDGEIHEAIKYYDNMIAKEDAARKKKKKK
jgi:teichoic acid transport system ATP-binding protein